MKGELDLSRMPEDEFRAWIAADRGPPLPRRIAKPWHAHLREWLAVLGPAIAVIAAALLIGWWMRAG